MYGGIAVGVGKEIRGGGDEMCGMERQEEIRNKDEGWIVRRGDKGVGGEACRKRVKVVVN